MHPSPAFRTEDRTLIESLVEEVGFGMVFATTPDGPRVVHTPLLLTTEGKLRFHISRGNALARHLDGMTALAVVNGPDAYVSPRWYADAAQVPTWNYVSVEMEGPARRLEDDALHGLLDALSARHEALIEGTPWTMEKTPPALLTKLKAGIIGFELEPLAWRPTFKLSQNKPADERERVAAALDNQGARAVANLMREFAR